MSRTLSATLTSATGQTSTTPVYLIRMGWDIQSPDVERRIATWDVDISWNAETWTASGASVSRLDANGGTLRLPNGDSDPWLNLIGTQDARGRTVQVYEHHTDTTASPQTDAVEIFSGIMDQVTIDKRGIQINMIAALLNQSFPPTSILPDTYSYLLTTGDRIYWGPDVVRVE